MNIFLKWNAINGPSKNEKVVEIVHAKVFLLNSFALDNGI